MCIRVQRYLNRLSEDFEVLTKRRHTWYSSSIVYQKGTAVPPLGPNFSQWIQARHAAARFAFLQPYVYGV